MMRGRIQQQLCRLPISHPAPSPRLYMPHVVNRYKASAQKLPPAGQCARLLTTSTRLQNAGPPKSNAGQPTPGAAPLSAFPPPLPEQPDTSQSQQQQYEVYEPPPEPRGRGIRIAVYVLATGIVLGTVVRFTIDPPALAEPGSDEDAKLLGIIQRKAASLAIVKQLSADPSWTSWDAYTTLPSDGAEVDVEAEERRRRLRLTSGALAGARGLAYQRVFRNAATGECVSVVYFGEGTAGWPGVVHGGALATVLDESLGRAAILHFPSRVGVTARLELTYRAPTYDLEFYVVRARPIVPDEDREAKEIPDAKKGESWSGRGPADAGKERKSDRKLWVEGAVESLNGKVNVSAKALFVVPRNVKLAPLGEGF